LKDIRKTASLSGEMRLKLPKKLVNLTAQNINNVLSRWKKLKVLHVSSRVEEDVNSEQAITQFGINLSAHKLLRKIVITKEMTLKEMFNEEIWEAWGEVQKVWFDPKRYWNPAKLENVVELKILWQNTPRSIRVALDQLGQEMPNLEALSIYQHHVYKGHQSNFEMILSFKNLKSLYVNTDLPLSGLVDVLHTLENMKNLELCFSISTDERDIEKFDEKQAKDIFQEAFEIVDKNFPRKSTSFSVSNNKYNLLIKKEKDQAPKRKGLSKSRSKTIKPKPRKGKIFSDSDFDSGENSDETDENLQWDPSLKMWVKTKYRRLEERYPDYARSRRKAGQILRNNGYYPKIKDLDKNLDDSVENLENGDENLNEDNETLGEEYENSSSENTYESDENSDSEADPYDNSYYRDSMEDLYSDGNDGPANIEVGSMKMWTSSEDENSDTNEIKIDENRSKTDENSDTDVMIGQE